MLVKPLLHDGIFIMLILCCFGFLLYIHFVLAINYKTIQATFSLFCRFSKISFHLIHGSSELCVIKQKGNGQHWATQSHVILDYLETGRTSVKCWRFRRKLQLNTYILHNKYRTNKRLRLDSGMILICSNNNYIKHHWHDMFNWQLITHITRAHGQINTFITKPF